jgi:hypothetical protein
MRLAKLLPMSRRFKLAISLSLFIENDTLISLYHRQDESSMQVFSLYMF